jgi:hypothetical protein
LLLVIFPCCTGIAVTGVSDGSTLLHAKRRDNA